MTLTPEDKSTWTYQADLTFGTHLWKMHSLHLPQGEARMSELADKRFVFAGQSEIVGGKGRFEEAGGFLSVCGHGVMLSGDLSFEKMIGSGQIVVPDQD